MTPSWNITSETGAFISADNLSSDTLSTHRSMLSPLSVLSCFIFTPVLRGRKHSGGPQALDGEMKPPGQLFG